MSARLRRTRMMDTTGQLPIYVVKTYRRTADREIGDKVFIDHDVPGYFHTQEDAIQAVEGNYGDIEEAGWYQFALICEVPSGFYGMSDQKVNLWFEFKPVDPLIPCEEEYCKKWDANRCDHNWKWQRIDGPPQKLMDNYGFRNIHFGGLG